MALLWPWAKVISYLLVCTVSLEVSHRVYWAINKRAPGLPISVPLKSVLTSFAALLPLLAVFLVTAGFSFYTGGDLLTDLGMRSDACPGAHITTGLTIAFISVSLMFAIGYLLGWFHIQPSKLTTDFCSGLPGFCGGVTDMISGSVFEEIIFRGYTFSILYQSFGSGTAVVGSAVIFSLIHHLKHNRLPALFTFNAFIFGILAGVLRLMTGSLWMPIGMHIGWNFASSSIFGLPCSGRLYGGGLIVCNVEGPEYITGGYYSPDAGLLGTAAMAFAASALLMMQPFG